MIDANSEDGPCIVVVALTFSLVCDCQNTLNMQKYTYKKWNTKTPELQQNQSESATPPEGQALKLNFHKKYHVLFLLQHADVSFLWHHYDILGGSNILKSVLYSSLDAIAYAIYLILFLGILFFLRSTFTLDANS